MGVEMKHTPAPRNDTLTALASQIAEVIQQARSHVRQSINQAMVDSYWEIGRLIVEHEQQGQARAAYGARQLAALSERLTAQFGRGFDERNLRNMRLFFQCFPNRNAVRTELSWTHYRTLLRVDNPSARDWYLREAISQNWSSRALDRQISVLYYERLLASQDKALVEAEAAQHAAPTPPRREEKPSWQKQQRELEGKRSKLRRELFNRQDEVEAQRNDLINQLEAQLQQQVEGRTLFTVEWELS
jgi:predicted nuclease of restriction endonuclease-like (RecB) superfamily